MATTVASRLNQLIQQYEALHPLSKQAFERARRVLPSGNTRSSLYSDPFPLVIQSAEGSRFTTVDGIVFEDFVSDYTAGIYGHSHPVIRDAIQDALSTGFSLGSVIGKEAELAEILQRRIPSLEKVRFCNSGTEANTFAIATAIAFTQRKKILVFDKGYHGGTLNFDKADNPMNLPHQFVVGKYNDVTETKPFITHELAAILVEPMQSAGGMRPASREFLAFLRKAADEVGTLLIFDEVVTTRLHYHGLQGALDIKPDMTTVGKYLGGGLPFGAFGGRAEIMDQYDLSGALSHSGTFNNNVFTMTAAVAAAKLITEPEIERLNSLGTRLREQANEMAKDAGLTRLYFTGYGSTVGVHSAGDEASLLLDSFYFSMLSQGIFIGRRGFIALNLMHGEESIDRFLGAVRIFLRDHFTV